MYNVDILITDTLWYSVASMSMYVLERMVIMQKRSKRALCFFLLIIVVCAALILAAVMCACAPQRKTYTDPEALMTDFLTSWTAFPGLNTDAAHPEAAANDLKKQLGAYFTGADWDKAVQNNRLNFYGKISKDAGVSLAARDITLTEIQDLQYRYGFSLDAAGRKTGAFEEGGVIVLRKEADRYTVQSVTPDKLGPDTAYSLILPVT